MAVIQPGSEDRLLNRFDRPDDQVTPQIVPLTNGTYLGVWADRDASSDVNAQVFAFDGTALGDPLLVNQQTESKQSDPRVTVLDDGRVLISWISDAGDDEDLAARLLTASGALSGSEFDLIDSAFDSYTVGDTVAVEAAGSVFLLYGGNERLERLAILNERDSGLDDVADRALFNAPNRSDFNAPGDVAILADGRIAVTYHTLDTAGMGNAILEADDVFTQIHNPETLALDSLVNRVNVTGAGEQGASVITPLADGGYFVAFEGENIDGDGRGVVGRRFDADANLLGGQFVLNETTAGDQRSPQVLTVDGNAVLVVWDGLSPAGDFDIYGRLFTPNGTPLTDEIVLNDIREGDQTMPDIVDFSEFGEGYVGLSFESDGAARDDDRDVYTSVFRVSLDDLGEGLSVADAREVAYLYATALDRNGPFELGGLNFWIDAREGGLTRRETAEEFLDNPEFEERFGDVDTLTDEQIIDTFYQNALGRDGDPAGFEFWLGRLQDPTTTVGDVLLAFATAPENTAELTFVETVNEVFPGEWDFVA
ncbi:MAG: DUF4214 domain-containing protein [Paracoccaceae bacterium]